MARAYPSVVNLPMSTLYMRVESLNALLASWGQTVASLSANVLGGSLLASKARLSRLEYVAFLRTTPPSADIGPCKRNSKPPWEWQPATPLMMSKADFLQRCPAFERWERRRQRRHLKLVDLLMDAHSDVSPLVGTPEYERDG